MRATGSKYLRHLPLTIAIAIGFMGILSYFLPAWVSYRWKANANGGHVYWVACTSRGGRFSVTIRSESKSIYDWQAAFEMQKAGRIIHTQALGWTVRFPMATMPPQWWFQYNSSDKAGITPTSAAAPIAMKYSVYVSYLAVPYWVFALVAAAYPIYSLIDLPNERRRKRFAAGQCTACGYDLRHTPDRCPECGLVPGNASPPARRFPRIGPIRGKIVARICLYPFFFAGFVFAFVEGYFWYYRK